MKFFAFPAVDHSASKITPEELDRFYMVHEKLLMQQGITNYFDWWDKAEKEAPLHLKELQEMLERMLLLIREYKKTGQGISEAMNAIQDWYLAALTMHERLTERGVL